MVATVVAEQAASEARLAETVGRVVAEREVVVGVVWEEAQEAKAVTAVEVVARVVAFVAEQCVLHE